MLEDSNWGKERKAGEQVINEGKRREESEPRISSRFSLDQQEKKDIDSCKSFYSNSWERRYQKASYDFVCGFLTKYAT